MTIKYTDEMIAEMRQAGTFTYDSAKAFADKYDISFRSVIAKVRALELDYVAKDPKVKAPAKPKVRAKSDIVNAILAYTTQELPSLSKMTVVDLEILEDMLA